MQGQGSGGAVWSKADFDQRGCAEGQGIASGGAYRARDHSSDETQQGQYLPRTCLTSVSKSTTRPPRGAFSFGESEWERDGGTNTADVSDAMPSTDHSVKLKATVIEIAEGRRPTAGSDLRRALRAGAKGA